MGWSYYALIIQLLTLQTLYMFERWNGQNAKHACFTRSLKVHEETACVLSKLEIS